MSAQLDDVRKSYTEDLSDVRKSYPRVSDIIGKMNAKAMENIPTEALEKACWRGTLIHEYCTNHLRGFWVFVPHEELKPYVDAFIEWADRNVEELIAFNERLYDDVKRFTGEFDLIVKLKGDKRTVLLDIKTSSQVSKSWAVQLAAYKHLCNLNGHVVDAVMNIHLKKLKNPNPKLTKIGEESMELSPKIKAVEIEHLDVKSAWDIFSSALTCYDYFDRKEAK